MEGAGVAAHPIVLFRIDGIEADADRKEAVFPQGRRPFRGETEAGGVEGQAGVVVEGCGDLLEIIPEHRLAAGEGDHDGPLLLELGGHLPHAIERDIALAAIGVVTVPAAIWTAIGDGESNRVEWALVDPIEMREQLVEGGTGVGREVGVKNELVAEFDDFFGRQEFLKKGGYLRMKAGEWSAGGHLLEERVPFHGMLLERGWVSAYGGRLQIRGQVAEYGGEDQKKVYL
jgi:hypothetical protein